MTRVWPVRLTHGNITLRPLRITDARTWEMLRAENLEWTKEWDATSPVKSAGQPPTFIRTIMKMRHEARQGRAMPFVVEYNGEFVGQLNISGIVFGALRGGHIGYWIDHRVAGRGIMTTAVALAIDHMIHNVGLHRVEIAIRPENIPSNRIAEKLGLTLEGVRPKFLHINHEWRDHNIYVVTSEQLSGRMVDRANHVS